MPTAVSSSSMVTSTPAMPGSQQKQPQAATPPNPSPRSKTTYQDLERRAIGAEAALEEVQKDFDTYRKEKCENERLINEELSETRKELSEAR